MEETESIKGFKPWAIVNALFAGSEKWKGELHS